MVTRLSTQDAQFYYLDDQNATTHIGSLLILDRATEQLQYDRLLATVESRLGSVPRYRQRIREVALGLGRPVWVDDHDFDITYHVRRSALPSPGAEEQLHDLVARLMSRPLDRSRPLWEMYLVEGLTDNRMAVLTKTHQALVEGHDAVEINQVLVDDSPRPPDAPQDIWLPAPEPSDASLVVGALTDVASRPWEIVGAVRVLSAPVAGVGSALSGSLRRVGSMLRFATDSAPDSPLNGPTSGRRRFTVTSADARTCARIARHHDCSMTDVVLAAIAGALRRWMLSRDTAVDATATVRALVPLGAYNGYGDGGHGDPGSSGASWDQIDDAEWTAAGVRGFVTDLPVGEPNPTVRLSQVAHLTGRHSTSGRRVAMGTRSWLPEVGPATFHAMTSRAAATLSGRSFNLPISIAGGGSAPQYLAGNRIVAAYPVPALVPQRALAIGLNHYNGRIFVAFNADRDIMWDLASMPEYLAEAVGELAARASDP
ncbi:wax ester/triacylglycerol synthase family O-acyltransferase [uncultured Williamsia sp.]|uniref:wax ester/triacylglycerol synthase family O-acyltransferase n=1 Tax=uncultured Williamsia sp. TaxID=259311 RepID=UPI0026102880|nr:wax ester/triacylglycerol synthase family O-acyltransferase [uncultured Williamsia sp.]